MVSVRLESWRHGDRPRFPLSSQTGDFKTSTPLSSSLVSTLPGVTESVRMAGQVSVYSETASLMCNFYILSGIIPHWQGSH